MCQVAVTIIEMSQEIFFIHSRIIFLSCTLVKGLFQFACQLFHIRLFYVLKYRLPLFLCVMKGVCC